MPVPDDKRKLVFFHSPNTRSTGVYILLEELGASYDLRVLNMKAGESRKPDYLAVNPLGKVPAIVDEGALVTEQGAIFIYLADHFPKAALAPAIGDPLRGPYLRWLVFYGSCFEPAITDRHMKRDPGSASASPYGDFDTVVETIRATLGQGPYLLGERFTAADILWGTALRWITMFKLIPDLPEFRGYIARVTARPSFMKIELKDKELAAALASSV